MLKVEEMREYVRVCRVRYDTARERLKRANEELEAWKEQVKLEEQNEKGARMRGVRDEI